MWRGKGKGKMSAHRLDGIRPETSHCDTVRETKRATSDLTRTKKFNKRVNVCQIQSDSDATVIGPWAISNDAMSGAVSVVLHAMGARQKESETS
jgi:hypothetical protein